MNYREGKIFWYRCQTDIYNDADTHCFGRNIFPIAFKYKYCTLYPLLEGYKEQMNIPIYSPGTAYTLGSGDIVILVFGQGLSFDNRM